MTDKTQQIEITEDYLLSLDGHIEVVNGELVDKYMNAAGFLHAFVGGNVSDVLKPFVEQHRLGYVLPDSLSYILHRVGRKIVVSRIPDLSFIRRERIPPDFDFNRAFPGAPDLAVEVVSPSEGAEDVQAKLHDYFTYGTEQVWVLYPTGKELYQYRGDGTDIRIYRGQAQVDVEALFPSLMITVDQFFRMPD